MLRIKVTRLGQRWHARLYDNALLLDEMAFESQLDIGYICREMLRWQHKMGNVTPWTKAARWRQDETLNPKYKVWYQQELSCKK